MMMVGVYDSVIENTNNAVLMMGKGCKSDVPVYVVKEMINWLISAHLLREILYQSPVSDVLVLHKL